MSRGIVKMPFVKDNDILIGAMVRDFMESNNDGNWYTEIVVAKSHPTTYEIMFRDRIFRLEKQTKHGIVNDNWDRNYNTYVFKLLDTPIEVFRFLKDNITHLNKWVLKLKNDLDLAESKKNEWIPVEGAENNNVN